MSTTSNLITAHLCSGTPTVSVVDNRGLSVRTLQYNRNAVGEAANELIAQQRYSISGQLLSSIDPRLFVAQQVDPAVLPNLLYHNSLSGQVLQNQSQDAGQQVTLYDIETGPVWQGSSRGHLKRFEYDSLHRLSRVFEQDGTERERVSERYVYGDSQANAERSNSRGQLVRQYDTAGLNEVGGYTVNGQPQQMVRQLLGNDSAHSDWQGAENQWLVVLEPERHQSRIGYNALGEVLNSVDAKGNQQRQQLDIAGLLASSGLTLVGQAVERPILTSITYSAGGQVLREAASNGVVTDYRYEPQTLRLSQLISTRPPQAGRSSLLQDLSYVYDPVGNILSISDAAIDNSYHNNQQIEPANDYQYDALYQLLTASGRENVGASRQGPGLLEPSSADSNQYSNYTRQYRYDRGGNLTQVRHVGNRNYTLDMLVSNTSNRAAQQTEFLTQDDVEEQFDVAGNLKQLVVGQPMTWDGRNQLQSVTQVLRSDSDDDEEHYQYDGGGTRVRKTTVSHTSGTSRRAQVIYLPGLELRRIEITQGASTRLEEGLQVISVGSAGRQQVRVLHWEAGKPDDIANDQLRASLDNQIGSSLLELDQNADILTQEEYYPFGGTSVWSGKKASETKYKFVRYSGKERDVTGLYYYGFRYYASWFGRWINPDPGGTVDGLNLYRMCRNNPVTLRDSNGLLTIWENFNEENGDLVYGLASPRGPYISSALGRPFLPEKKDAPASIIDLYNNAVSGRIVYGVPTKTLSKFMKSPRTHEKKLFPPINIKDLAKAHREYPLWDSYFLAGESNTKFNVASIYREVHDSHGRSPYHEWSMTPAALAPKLLWKRGSKLGIELAASGAGNKIHFVIDELNISSVVRKEGGEGQSITASELRYAYRNRERLVGRIHFYKDNVETESPWNADPELWRSYNPGSASGGRETVPSRRQSGTRNVFSTLGKIFRRQT